MTCLCDPQLRVLPKWPDRAPGVDWANVIKSCGDKVRISVEHTTAARPFNLNVDSAGCRAV
ncbi:hypothetical protein D9613_009477 [Agrocybe pediades]|uniref:Uncharacterized protein n=1 Tax=Agrocybe pediades TaxID=84607 RepID=A0A8H4R2X6_9AGAR|nr:hypothetical protein D9613_009477 [Agrocybe pediades]